MFAWGLADAMAQSSVMGRLSWCSTLCMCEKDTNTEVQCFEEDDIFQLMEISARSVARLKNKNWSVETHLQWCDEMCLCNIETGKEFRCTEPHKITQLIVNRIGIEYFIMPEENSEIKQEEERSVDEEEEPSLDQETEHKKRSERKKNKKTRKQKKNQKKHRNQSEDSHESEPEPEPQPEPEPEVYIPTTSLTPTPPMETPTPTSFSYHHEEDVEEIDVHEHHEPLPRHEAVAASPAVTAMQTPSRKLQPYSTAESYTPRELEGLSPRVQPVVEVPKEKKTMASMVSQDLDDLGTTVRNIKNDVMLNQRILLVTVAIAGIAMLGVLILAIMSCTSRRQQAANNAKKNSNKDGNHSPKINLEEAW